MVISTYRSLRRIHKHVMIATLAAATLLLMTGCGPYRAAWVSRNNYIIDRIAVYPGARETPPRSTDPRSSGILGGGTQGYATIAAFRLPNGTTARQFNRYFTLHYPAGWKCRTRPASAEVVCDRGDAEALIIYYPTSPPTYKIEADKGYQQDKDAGN